MPANSFKYATIDDLKDVFQDCYKYSSLTQLTGDFIEGSTNVGGGFTSFSYNGISDPANVYVNGSPLSKVTSITAVNQFKWDDAGDILTITLATGIKPIDDKTIEVGKDTTTMLDDALVLASDELNAKIDNKYPRPLPKTRVTPFTDLEYESIVKRVTCLLCAKNLIRSKDPLSEDSLVYDQEAKEIIDGLNNGAIKLVWENDATEIGSFYPSQTNGGTIFLEEVKGNWTGKSYDVILLRCSTAGAFNACEVDAYFGDSNKIGFANVMDLADIDFTFKPSGAFDYLGGGLMVRFSETANGTMNVGDLWTIPVRNTELTGGITNSNVKSLNAVRNR